MTGITSIFKRPFFEIYNHNYRLNQKVHLNGRLYELLGNHISIKLRKFNSPYQLISLRFDLYLNFLHT